ncbi:preg-like related protein [Cyclospora cayetanensis]|uniref:Preg-like related protein n=1 Tax=Cyclospora cayetanensis TaxID=88456 RepID=A0A1D3CTX5_9EIME|nr:preg-like related protein [Cyclospora cayetanensis]
METGKHPVFKSHPDGTGAKTTEYQTITNANHNRVSERVCTPGSQQMVRSITNENARATRTAPSHTRWRTELLRRATFSSSDFEGPSPKLRGINAGPTIGKYYVFATPLYWDDHELSLSLALKGFSLRCLSFFRGELHAIAAGTGKYHIPSSGLRYYDSHAAFATMESDIVPELHPEEAVQYGCIAEQSICPPATTISAYIPRLYRHFRCSEEGVEQFFDVASHQLLLACMRKACLRILFALRYSNRYYARVGGVGLAELNRLELAFLKLVKFDLAVSKEDYETYRKTVLLACPRRSAAETTTCRTEQQLSQQHAEANSAASCEEAPEGPSSGAASKVSSDAAGDEFESTAATTTATATTANISSTPTAAEPPRALHALAQQQDKSQETQQQQQEQASCFRCFVAVSNSSTVSTTPESGPPYVPPSAACGTAPFRGAVQQGHIQDRNVRAAHRDESASQEEALRRHLVQQWHQHGGERQWQNCGMGFVGIQHQEQLPLQHARRVLQSQHYQLHCWDCAAAEQQQVPKQPSRGEYIMYEASMSPSNSFAPSRSSSRDSLSLCGGFGMETDDKMTTAASDEELQLASPMNALRDVLAAEAP